MSLQKFFDFNEGDLAANRSGRLSPRQAERLKGMHKSYQGNYVTRAVIVVGALALVAIAAFFLLSDGFGSASIGALIRGVLVIGLVLFLVYQRANKKVDTGVRKAQGPVNIVKVEKEVIDHARGAGKNRIYRKRIQVYEMRVGGTTFDNVSEDLPNLIQNGDEYTFYYTGHPFTILSAEVA